MISYLAMAVVLQAAPAITPARRRQPLGQYFAAADYPAAALAAREEGRVDAALTIGTDGRVTGCTVQRSSGSAALDAATCRILRSRARYAPARNFAGAAVAGHDVARLIWFLPGPGSRQPAVIDAEFVPRPPAPSIPPPPPSYVNSPRRDRANLASYFSSDDYPAGALRAGAEGTVRFRLIIGVDGRVQNCIVTASSGSPDLDNATCRILRSRARYTPARDYQGNPTVGSDSGTVIWRLPPPPPPPEPPPPAVRKPG